MTDYRDTLPAQEEQEARGARLLDLPGEPEREEPTAAELAEEARREEARKRREEIARTRHPR